MPKSNKFTQALLKKDEDDERELLEKEYANYSSSEGQKIYKPIEEIGKKDIENLDKNKNWNTQELLRNRPGYASWNHWHEENIIRAGRKKRIIREIINRKKDEE